MTVNDLLCVAHRMDDILDKRRLPPTEGFREVLYQVIRREWLPNEQDHIKREGAEYYPISAEQSRR